MVKDVSCEREVRLKENSEISRKPTMCTNRNLIFLSIEKGWHAEVFVRGNATKHRFWWKLFERNSEIWLVSCRVAQECVYWLLRYRFNYMFSMRMPYFRFNGASASHVIQFNIQETCIHESWAILPCNMWKGFPAGGKRTNFIVACGSETALPKTILAIHCHERFHCMYVILVVLLHGFQKNAQL